MSSMLDATERSRPIMQYVRELETKVRQYRSIERRFNAGIFALGFGAGAAAMLLYFLLLRH